MQISGHKTRSMFGRYNIITGKDIEDAGKNRIPNTDQRLLDTIGERGEACTPEEEAALERFSAEFERASELLSSRQPAVEPRRTSFR